MQDKILTIKKSTLVDIANQIREKNGSTDLIKVADLDDAVAELSGGGIVEVDELPNPYLCTPVPNSGYVEKVYFDTNLSIEQVVAELDKLTYVEADGESDAILLASENVSVGAAKNNGAYAILYIEANELIPYFISTEGWDPEFNGELEINSEVMNEATDSINGSIISVGAENDKIAKIFYLDKQPNPEFNADAIYKLPDETYWLYKENGFEQISGKIYPMSYGTYNNPEFGFYYGQTFGMDDPITFDIPFLLEKMAELELTEFTGPTDTLEINVPVFIPFNGMSVFLCPLKFTISPNLETGETNIHLYSSAQYTVLDYTFTVSSSESFTFTMSELYEKILSEIEDGTPISTIKMVLDMFAIKYGYVTSQSTNYYGFDSEDKVSEVNNLNNPDNEIYKFIKIGK